MTVNSALADLMLSICVSAGPTQTVDPGEVARAFAEISDHGDRTWPSHLQSVRDTAVGLARDGKIIIYCQGAPVDPETFRGTYRLGCPNLG
ncbi:MAG: DUF3253 domain-containing protein [Beijerinckiaceae bacterium]